MPNAVLALFMRFVEMNKVNYYKTQTILHFVAPLLPLLEVGRPRKDVDKQVLFVLRAGETDFYKVGFVEDIHQFESMNKAEQQAVPHGVDLVLKVDQPYCKEAVEVIYDVYSRYVGKGEWIELSESQIKEVRELLE